MPWHTAKDSRCPSDKPWAVVKDSDGSVVACHISEEAAQKQVAALYINVEDAGGKMLNKSFSAEIKSLAPEGKPEGTFSAVVAVYGNVDKVGDRISDSAFDATLEKWRKSGDPIPIVLAHEWNDPFAHIGYAMPDKVKSVPGVGLFVEEGHLDIEDNPTAKQVHRLMERRSLKEFSFGYSVPDGGSTKSDDGAYDLSEINLFEFGPCLKGVNDETQLLEVKAALHGEEGPSLEDRLSRLEDLLAHFVESSSPEATPDEDVEKSDEELKVKSDEEDHTPNYDLMLTNLEAETALEAAEADSLVRDVLGKSDSLLEYTLRLDDLENELK